MKIFREVKGIEEPEEKPARLEEKEAEEKPVDQPEETEKTSVDVQ